MKPSKKNFKIIQVVGPQGSGKGTQAKLLAKKFKLKYLGSGDVLRARQKLGDFTGKKLIRVMNSGALIPSFIIVKILGDEFIDKNRNIVTEWTENESLFMNILEKTYPEAFNKV